MTGKLILFALGVFLALAPLLFHEMGHWAALSRLKVPVKEYWLGLGPAVFRWRRLRIGMLPIGGAVVPDMEPYKALCPRHRMWVALAGPAASVLYGILALLAWYVHRDGLHAPALQLIAVCNFVLAGVNLLPVPPLDGFQALCSWLESSKRPISERTLGFAHRAGNGLVYGVGFLVLGLFLLR